MNNKKEYLLQYFLSFIFIFYELLLTRIFSFFYFYHRSFLFIIIGLFFFGLGNIFTFYLIKFKLNLNKFFKRILFSLLLLFLLVLPFMKLPNSFLEIIYLLTPFLFLGILFSINYSYSKNKIINVFVFDCLGFISGIVLFPFFYSYFGDLKLIMLIVSLLLILNVLYNKRKIYFVFYILIIIIMLNSNYKIKITHNVLNKTHLIKKIIYENCKIERTFFDKFCRVDVVSNNDIPKNKYIYYDGMYSARLMDYNIKNKKYFDIIKILSLINFKKYKNVAVLGSGGGMETYFIDKNNTAEIYSVDISPSLNKFLKQQNNKLFSKKNIHIITDDARNFIRKSKMKFDLITLSLMQTSPASFLAGAHTQNYVFTTNSFKDYYDKLTDDGIIVIIQNEEKLVKKTYSVLTESYKNQPDLKNKIHIFKYDMKNNNTPYKYLLLYSKSIIDETKLKKIIRQNNFINLYNHKKNNFYYNYTGKNYDKYKYNLIPVTDDNPFFYNIFKNYYKNLIAFFTVLILFCFGITYYLNNKFNLKKHLLVFFLSFLTGFVLISVEQTLIYKLSFPLTFYHSSLIVSFFIIFILFLLGIFLYKTIKKIKLNFKIILFIIYFILIYLQFGLKINNTVYFLLLFLPLNTMLYLSFLNKSFDDKFNYIPLIMFYNGVGMFGGAIINIILLNVLGININLFLQILIPLILC